MSKREKELRQKRAALIEKALGITRAAETESRSMTAEELGQVTVLRSEAATLLTEIETVVALEADAASLTRSANGGGSHIDVHDNHQDERFHGLGEQLMAVAQSSKRGAAIDPRLLGIQERAATGASEGVPSDGGFLVDTDVAGELFKRAHSGAQLLQRVRRIPISAGANGIKMNAVDESSRVAGSRWGGVQTYWLAEAGSFTATRPKFRQIRMDLLKLAGLFYATDELLSDAAALGSVAEQGFAEEFSFIFDDVIFQGIGGATPLGYTKSPALVTVAKEAGQGAKTVVVENILNMYSRMYAASIPNAAWFVNQDVMPALFTMGVSVGVGGVPVFMPAGGVSGAPYNTILGRPVVPIEQAATLGTVGDVTFADLSQYLWIEKGGVQAATSIHVQFLTDEMVFRWIVRVNGQPAWNLPMTPAKGSNTQSPFVALATR